MPNYRLIQYRRYHDSLVSEYFWQLENVMDVLRGRAQHQQRFKEATLSTVFSVMQNAGTIGNTVSAAGGVILGFLGQYQESRRVGTLTPEYLSGQWEELKKIVETTAEKAVEQYRFFLERCSESDAVELGRVSAQRLWEYIPREKLSFTIENMLIGILKGKSGRWQDDWRNTGLTESAESNRQTAEGALKHAGIAYCDENHQWNYALHPRDKDAVFPKYGFMVLPEMLAKARILEKRHIPFIPSIEQTQLLENTWSTSIMETIVEDSTTPTSSLTPEVADRLQQLETDWLSFCEWQDTVEKRLERLQTQVVSHEVAIVEVKQNIVVQHEHLSRLQRNVMDISESRRFTYIPKPYFQPRIGLWAVLERRLSIEGPTLPVILVGLGGMGKTSLATEWTNKQKTSGKYHSIRRMLMDNESVESSLYDLAHDLYVETNKREREDWLKDIAQHFQAQSWLMIWDNVEDYSAIEDILPYFTSTTSTQQLLITSRDTTSWQEPIMVDTFMPEESIAYIQHQMTAAGSPWFKREHAEKLAECFDHHPLALELAMGTVCLYQRSLEQYLKALEDAGLSTLKAPNKKLASQARINTNRLTTLWKTGIANLPSDAIALLQLMSFIDVDGVGRDLMEHYFGNDPERCDEALLALRQQAFIKSITSDTLEIWGTHRLLQEVVRDDFVQTLNQEEAAWSDFLSKSWESIAAVFPKKVIISIDMSAITRGVGYGRTFWIHIQDISAQWSADMVRRCLLSWKAQLFQTVGWGEHNLARFSTAEESLHTTLVVYKTIHGETSNHSDIAMTLNNLGLVYKAQGNIVRAIELYEESLGMCRLIYATTLNHPNITVLANIAMILSNLGLAYKVQGNTVRSIELYEESLKVRRIYATTENHPDIALILSNLGVAHQTQGNNSRAIELLNESLTIQRFIYTTTPNHPSIATTLNNLGRAYQAQGNNPRAIEFYEGSLVIFRLIYTAIPNHPSIATILNNLGHLYQAQGNHMHAIERLNESLMMFRFIYTATPNHPSIATILNNLGRAHQSHGNDVRAIEFYEESLVMKRLVYTVTPHHHEIARTLNGLGNAYRAQGNHVLAIRFYEEALTMYRLVYAATPNHPDIAEVLSGLGSVYQAQNNTVLAIELYKESLAMYRLVYAATPNHPEIGRTLVNLAIASSSSYLQQYTGSFFHFGGCHKISDLQSSLSSGVQLSPTQVTDRVRQAIADGTERKKYFANFM